MTEPTTDDLWLEDETPEEFLASFGKGLKLASAPPGTTPEEYRALFTEAWDRPPTDAEMEAAYPPVANPDSSQVSEVQP